MAFALAAAVPAVELSPSPAHRISIAMADFMKILQQAQEMQGRLQKVQEELQHKTVTAASGGGMVTVEADGRGQLKKVHIDPSVVNPADVEMLEDLVLVAVTEVQKKAAALAQDEMGKLAGGLQLPFKLPF
jgi:nucleoid-associated protein EbfC